MLHFLLILTLHTRLIWSTKIVGFKVEEELRNTFDSQENVTVLPNECSVKIRVFGTIINGTQIALTEHKSSCQYLRSEPYEVELEPPDSASVQIQTPSLKDHNVKLYFCSKSPENLTWTHVGNELWLSFQVLTPLIPIWLKIMGIIFCVVLSSILNGLCLGLLALDVTDLTVLSNAGSDKQKKYAKAILPVRKRGNFLLCSIILGSTAANALLTIQMEQFFEGWVTVALSTCIIVILVEIIPGSLAVRYGIVIGAKTIWLVRAVMILTSPISYPLSKILDISLGKEITLYTKDRIKELVKITKEIKKGEQDIIAGALEMRDKTVKEIMTPLPDVFMLSVTEQLNFATVSRIFRTGYSRIPIYDGERRNVIGLLFTKDLALVDPHDKLPIETVIESYQHPLIFVQEDTNLEETINVFKDGRSHMACVTYKDEEKSVIGVVTLEDVFEELIKFEIVDETDEITDNRSKRKRERQKLIWDFLTALETDLDNKEVDVSREQLLAALQFLSVNCEPFSPTTINPKILGKMLRQQDVTRFVSGQRPRTIFPEASGSAFIILLEGKVEVWIPQEELRFISGPFTCFGIPYLLEAEGSTQPSYTVKNVSDTTYIHIHKELYLAGVHATNYVMGTGPPPNEREGAKYKELFERDGNDVV